MNTKVFNRWGSQIFETTSLVIDWNGSGLNSGNYYWLIEYTDKLGNQEKLNSQVYLAY